MYMYSIATVRPILLFYYFSRPNKIASKMRYFTNPYEDYSTSSNQQQKASSIINNYEREIPRIINTILQALPPIESNCDGGLYVGCAGVSYMLYHVASSSVFDEKRHELLQHAMRYYEVSIQYTRRKRDPMTSFLLGDAGIHVLGFLLANATNNSELMASSINSYNEIGRHLIPIDFFKHGSDEFFVGRAGYLCGALMINRLKKGSIPDQTINSIARSILESGRKYSRTRKSPCPLMYAYYDTEYIGAAHGISSILLMLLNVPAILNDAQSAHDIKVSVDFILSMMTKNGNYPSALDELHAPRPVEHELVHWCHGAPGVVYLMAKAYLIWKEEKYLSACLKAADLVWTCGLLKKGPGICHGVAGSGYVFLLLYSLTKDPKYLYRAKKFQEFLYTDEFKSARTPDAPWSLYEGWSGTVCFMCDIQQPEQSEFPLFPFNLNV